MTDPIMIRYKGRLQSITAWARELDICQATLNRRIDKHGTAKAMRMPAPKPRQRRKTQSCKNLGGLVPDGATLDVIAAEIGVSRERARQITDIAIAKLRVGHRLIELLGRERADNALKRLEGATIGRCQKALRACEAWAEKTGKAASK